MALKIARRRKKSKASASRARPGLVTKRIAATLLCFLSLGRAAVGTEADVYRIRVFQDDDAAGHSVTMRCSSEQQSLPTGRLELSGNGQAPELTVIASCSGNLYLMFATGGQFLFVGSQPYAHILLGPSHLAHKTIVLSAPPSAALDDSPNGVLHKLVDRLPTYPVARLVVDVEPGQ